jgi:peptidoglycan/LPS O-acetylase OafA/YrhL
MNAITISDRLRAASGRPAGFDSLRITLALAVLCSHTINICLGEAYTRAIWLSPVRPFLAIILPMFFALSGFLVAGSLERSKTLISFLGLRAIRLVPALAVDTFIAALIIGPIFTNLSLRDYFSAVEFHRYFLNIVGDVHFGLPGVYSQNVLPEIVNGQLWTLPFELFCYVSITAISIAGLVRNRSVFLGTTCVLYVAVLIRSIMAPSESLTCNGKALVLCFLVAVAMYLYRDRIKLSFFAAAFSFLASVLLMRSSIGDVLAVVPATYLTLYLGTLNPRRMSLVSSGDYSYGIFLYGFPIQQAVAVAFGEVGRSPYMNLPISIAVTGTLAVGSWWLIEKPALKLRHRLFAFEAAVTKLALSVPLGRHLVQPARGPRLEPSPVREAT